MRNKSVIPFVAVVGGGIACGLLWLFHHFPTMPLQASVQAEHVDSAWYGLMIVETTVYGLVMSVLLYCLFMFRAKNRAEQGEKFDRSPGRVLEVGWILVSVALTLSLAALGAHELRALINDPSADIDVEVHAQQFNWEFYYPATKQYGTKLYMELGKRHRIILTSKDVVHSFWVPEFRIKQDAVPGKVISMIVTPTKLGTYTLMCNQLCGWGHTDMQGSVEVVDHAGFEANTKASDF
ncbi:MAG: cytochrome c oxidase subunit II [Elusimicrobiota bacterium]